jgi:hypothetical protein
MLKVGLLEKPLKTAKPLVKLFIKKRGKRSIYPVSRIRKAQE